MLIVLLSLLLSARSRELTLARLATMGLGRGRRGWLLAAETLPAIVAAAIGGVACAWLLAPLVGPALNLAAFTRVRRWRIVGGAPAAIPAGAAAGGLVGSAALLVAWPRARPWSGLLRRGQRAGALTEIG